jgi:hypothetical protein
MSELTTRWIVLRRHIDAELGLVTGVVLDVMAHDEWEAKRMAPAQLPRPDNDLCAVCYEAYPVHPRYPSPRAQDHGGDHDAT